MIDRQQLLADLKPLLRELEADLRARCDEVAQINAGLTKEYEEARSANRAGVTFEEWRADLITQVAVAWVLSCVFVRFLEDNALISPPRISGPLHGADDGQGLMRARDERDAFFRSHPTQTDRDYLLSVCGDLARLPGAKDVFGPHNPVSAYRNWLSGDAAQKLIEFFQKIDADGTGEVLHDFTDDQWDTRFLGDLYQDLSEAARKKYALLQTPIFVEEFILERTLEPAIKEFGLKGFKMIDPACGSGHFLLGSFARILNHWRKAEPGTNDRERVNRALASVHGVDLNPYAVAIARFRLLLAAMKEYHVTRMKDAPDFQFNLACGDSLLHGSAGQQVLGFHELAHHYQSEDIDELRRILRPGQYHAVVANPPYITVKDKALNQAYRGRYPDACHMKYSLSAPFMQRLFELGCAIGFIGQITANSFMKREFGKKLIERYLPRVDLTHVIDSSGARIPGHGTPTVILFGHPRRPVAPMIRTVMSIKGEPGTPMDYSKGLVWTAIRNQIDVVGSESAYISVADLAREQLAHHPWAIGGGGAAELKQSLDGAARTLGSLAGSVGFMAIAGDEDVYHSSSPLDWYRRTFPREVVHGLMDGRAVRDWTVTTQTACFFDYDSEAQFCRSGFAEVYLWLFRTLLRNSSCFNKTKEERGLDWREWTMVMADAVRSPHFVVYATVATGNQFCVQKRGAIGGSTVQVIVLPQEHDEQVHLGVTGALNSSTAGFWLKQVCQQKGSSGIGRGVYDESWEKHLAFNATNILNVPLPREFPTQLSVELQRLSDERASLLQSLLASADLTQAALHAVAEKDRVCFGRMVALQEELDWACYYAYGVVDDVPRCANPPTIRLGERPFEIVLARRVAAGEEDTTWFERHGSDPITRLPANWPEDYKEIIERRIELIENDLNIGLLERPEYKRRWNTEPWEQQQEKALRDWLLNRLENYFDLDGRMNDQKTITARGNLHEPRLTSVARVADLAKQDKDFMQVAELYAGRMDFDVANLVGDLIAAESVPCLPVLRYKPSGMDKRAAWERTWDLQRLEDAVDALFEVQRLKKIEPGKAQEFLHPLVAALRIEEQARAEILREAVKAAGYVAEAAKQNLDLAGELILKPVTDAAQRAKQQAVGDIPVPPKYTSADFLSSTVWRLRGKLDVPKERWVSFPHCEGEDGTGIIAWAGYDHLQLARAIAEHYEHAKEHEGRKLVPLLACIGQLIPWLKQWHNDLDPAFGTRMGDYFENYLAEEAKALGLTVAEVMAWTPPERPHRRGGRRRSTGAAES